MRYIQFDALRGMAALSVLLGHFIGMLPVFPDWLVYLSRTPVHIIWDGAAAVNLFFVLSGVCVSLPYMRQDNPRPIAYVPFLLRRFFRLYPAYVVALFLCLVAKSFYIAPAPGSVSTWVMEFWQWESLTYYQWMTLFGMIYHIDTNLLDPPTWSLVVEMKMAFILPIMFWLYQHLSNKWQIMITFGLLLLMFFHASHFDYAGHFALGIILAKKRGDY